MNLNTRYVWSDNFCSTEIDDTLVLLVIDSGKYFSFSKTAKAIWQLLESPSSAEEVTAHLVTRFDISVERCLSETTAFISALESRELVKKAV